MIFLSVWEATGESEESATRVVSQTYTSKHVKLHRNIIFGTVMLAMSRLFSCLLKFGS